MPARHSCSIMRRLPTSHLRFDSGSEFGIRLPKCSLSSIQFGLTFGCLAVTLGQPFGAVIASVSDVGAGGGVHVRIVYRSLASVKVFLSKARRAGVDSATSHSLPGVAFGTLGSTAGNLTVSAGAVAAARAVAPSGGSRALTADHRVTR